MMHLMRWQDVLDILIVAAITGARVAPSTGKLAEPPPHKKAEAAIRL
jgi:hypothetical protein